MKKRGKQYLALALTVAVATPVVATNVIPTIIVMAAPGPYATERVSAPGKAIDGRIAVDVGFAVVKNTEINADNTEITVEFEREISDAVKNTIKAEIVRDDQTSQHKLEESGTLVQADKMTMIPGSSGKWKGLKVRIDPRDYHNDEQIGIKVHSTISGVTMKLVIGIPINQLSGKAVVMPSEGDSQLKISIRNPINSSPYNYIYEYGFGTSGDSVVFHPATVSNIAGSSSGEATITLDLSNNDRVPAGKKAYIKVISKYSDNRYLASTIGDIQSETQATQPPTQPATTQPATTQPATTQPATTQPATTQPATTQPTTTQPATTQPATTQPATTQPATTQPATTQPATTQPATTQPPTARPTQPPTARPTQPPVSTQPTQPTTAQPTPTQPIITSPVNPRQPSQPMQPTLTLPPTQPTPTQPTPTQPTQPPVSTQPTQPTTARPTQPTPMQPPVLTQPTQPTTARPTQPMQPMQPPVSTQTPTQPITARPTQPTTAELTHPTEPIDPRVTTTLPNKQVATPTDARRRTTGGGSSNPGGSSTSTRRSRVVPEPKTGLTTTNFTRVPEEVPTEPNQFEKSLKTDADTLLGDPVIRRTTAEPPSEHSRPRKTVTDLDTGISQRASSSTNRGYTTDKTKEKTKEKENKVVPKTADVAPLATSATAIFTSIVGLFTAGKLRKKKKGEE